ncbi:MAG: HindVP family restriction endonuclease [Lyngbya sp.]|nr:HindVP family restriction endonuclease [Lyngbya sp.]
MIESEEKSPGLFGLTGRSNRNFSKEIDWGKNKFNSSFPTALTCYMSSLGLSPVYLTLGRSLKVEHGKITATDIFGANPSSQYLYFSFESDYTPYRTLIADTLPRIDLVTLDISSVPQCIGFAEVKLTALPDNSTYSLSQSQYGCELVIRPVTIVYLALSIADIFSPDKNILLSYLEPVCQNITNWNQEEEVVPILKNLSDAINKLFLDYLEFQKPLILQPIWKTEGKTFQLCENCLDVFVWSNFAFTRLFFDAAKESLLARRYINRFSRTIAWLARMLYEFAQEGKLPSQKVFKEMSYNAQTDKAFALNGYRTNPYMRCSELINPRIKKDEIKNIILGQGQLFKS